MLVFEDLESPLVQTEQGEARSVSVRVMPSSYDVGDEELRFEGHSPELGRVVLQGRLDQAALAVSRRTLGDDAPVLAGSLRLAPSTPRPVHLRWWISD